MSCALSILSLLKPIPFAYDVVKMIEDDAPDSSPICGTHIVRVGLYGLESLDIEPVFRLCVALATMNMNWFIPFVGVEKEPPAQHDQYRWHLVSVSLYHRFSY